MSETSLSEQGPRLLAIVEVEKENRILCQADGCGHSVYKRIHVMRIPGGFSVLGSECYKRLYSGIPTESSSPQYYSTDGRCLTDFERECLIGNTDEFIRVLESVRLEREVIYAEQMARQALERERRKEIWHEREARMQQEALELAIVRQEAMGAAKQNCLKLYPGLNLDSPGWMGLVYVEMLRLVRTGYTKKNENEAVSFNPIKKPGQNLSLFDIDD